MKFSLRYDLELQKLFAEEKTTEDLKEKLNEITLSCQKSEEVLKMKFGSEYSSLVIACSTLKELLTKVNEIKDDYFSFIEISKNNKNEHEKILQQVKTNETALERLNILQNDTFGLREFITNIMYSFSCNIEIYNKISNLSAAKNLLISFKNFKFYPELLNLYFLSENTTKTYLFNITEKFLNKTFKNTKLELGNKLFDGLKSTKNDLLKNEMYEVIYSFKKLDQVKELCDFINETRERLLKEVKIEPQKNKSPYSLNKEFNSSEINDPTLEIYISNILISHCLVSEIPVKTFYDEIFFWIMKLENNFPNDIIKLLLVVSSLEINSQTFEDYLEMAIYNCFDIRFKNSDFPDEVLAFILNSFGFLDLLNEYPNEHDDILFHKIDDSLILYLNSADSNNIFEKEENINTIINKLQERRSDVKLEVQEKMESKNNEMLNMMVQEFYFVLKNSKKTKEVVTKILTYKSISNNDFKKQLKTEMNKKIDEMSKKWDEDDRILMKNTLSRICE